jgi:tRNA G37 N-methylase TrmD
MESFVTNLYKPKGEKFNRKHVHTLWRNAHLFDTSVCGRYISYAEIKEAYEAASN